MPFPTYGKFLLDPFGEKPQSAVERTEMESGPPKQRLKQSRRMIQRTISVIYTASEYASFKDWFVNTVSLGVDWDTWVDPYDGQTKDARIVNGDYTAKSFVDSPGAELSWQVDMVVETWE